jgi:hypothetical protein
MFNHTNIDTIQSKNGNRVQIITTAEFYQVKYQSPEGHWHAIDTTPFMEQAIMEANLWLNMKWGNQSERIC